MPQRPLPAHPAGRSPGPGRCRVLAKRLTPRMPTRCQRAWGGGTRALVHAHGREHGACVWRWPALHPNTCSADDWPMHLQGKPGAGVGPGASAAAGAHFWAQQARPSLLSWPRAACGKEAPGRRPYPFFPPMSDSLRPLLYSVVSTLHSSLTLKKPKTVLGVKGHKRLCR